MLNVEPLIMGFQTIVYKNSTHGVDVTEICISQIMEHNLTMLQKTVGDLKKKVNNTIRFTDNTAEYYSKLDDPNFSDYSFDILDGKNGKDLDVLDNVIQFPIETD